jgi:putative transposase
VQVAPVLGMVGDFAAYLDEPDDEAAVMAIRHSRTTGRPVGAAAWIAALEARTARTVAPARRGPKPAAPHAADQGELFHTVSP